MTKTTQLSAADPVTAAESRLADAEQALADAKAEADSVYTAMLTGTQQVTSERFAGIRHAVEHAIAIRGGAAEALTQARTAARLDRIRGAVAPLIQRDTADAKRLEDAAAQIEAGVAAILDICTRQRREINGAIAALRRERVPQRTGHRNLELENANAGVTFADAAWGHQERVIVDGQEFTAVPPRPVIEDALRRGAASWPGLIHEFGHVGTY